MRNSGFVRKWIGKEKEDLRLKEESKGRESSSVACPVDYG